VIDVDPLQNVLSRLSGVRKSNGGYLACCPAHDDQHASLSVSLGDEGLVLLYCHAGCATEDVCKAIGLRLNDLFPPNSNNNGRGRIIATYDYKDAAGTLLYQVVRFDPKAFRQRRPDGNGGWVWKLGDTPRVLYGLPELLAAGPDEWIIVSEGEKDVDRLSSRGLIATCNPGGAGKWAKLSDDSALEGRRVAIIGDKDTRGRIHVADVARRLHGRVAELRVLELPGPGKDVTDWFAAGGTVDELRKLIESTASYSPPPEARTASQITGTTERPIILIDTEEHRVVRETVVALTADPDLYQRGGILVRVVRELQPDDGILRSPGSATIQVLPSANLRERMTRWASFTKFNAKGVEVAAHPTSWLVAAVDARAEWDGVRRLLGVSDSPILRADGSILQEPGYDERTGVLFEPAPGVSFPRIDPEVNVDDATEALACLLEAVCDFPFEAEEHKAAWLAALLTPLARFAFSGPSPMFLIDANVRGAGKGLLAQVIGHIVLGREIPVSSYSHDSDEMRKKLTAIAIAGDRMILFDNLEGMFGNDAIDRALTSTRWKDRILGKSEEVELPLFPAWYATGNNAQVAADTTRRIIHVRLDCLEEHPEDRAEFTHPNLIAWVDTNRGKLLSAALTILSAYLQRGHSPEGLKPYGSFEGWSRVVREAVIWVGLPDPCLTRTKLAESADTTLDALSQLMAAWQDYDPSSSGIVVSEMLSRLYPADREQTPSDAASTAMRRALENLVGTPPGKPPTPRQVGNKLRGLRRRVVAGRYLDTSKSERSGALWRLYDAGHPSASNATRVCES
jgi:hypothetical protein